MSDPLKNFRVVLVNPLYAGNVGAVCRCMANCGMSDLVIAERTYEIDNDECRKRAMHAETIFESRREYPTLAEAVADCGLVAGTSARQGLYRSHAKTAREWAPYLYEKAQNNRIALVFGTEDKGLSKEQLALCTQIIQIPSHPDYTSLNLSHAVMICAYEIFVASETFVPIEEPCGEAPSAVRERMLAAWESTLYDIGFMKEDKAEHMMLGLRRILSRGLLTESDVKILMGIARQSQWCALELKKLKEYTPEQHSS